MAWERIEHDWGVWKPRIRERWARLAPSEIDEINGRRDLLVGRIKEAYGIDASEAEAQVHEFEQEAGLAAGGHTSRGPGRRTD